MKTREAYSELAIQLARIEDKLDQILVKDKTPEDFWKKHLRKIEEQFITITGKLQE